MRYYRVQLLFIVTCNARVLREIMIMLYDKKKKNQPETSAPATVYEHVYIVIDVNPFEYKALLSTHFNISQRPAGSHRNLHSHE